MGVRKPAGTDRHRPEQDSTSWQEWMPRGTIVREDSALHRGGDWVPGVEEAPRNATYRPFRAGQAEASIAASDLNEDLRPLLKHCFPLSRITEAYELFGQRSGGVIKDAIRP